jgi:hypothetical protein
MVTSKSIGNARTVRANCLVDLVKHQARSFLNQPLCCFHDDERFARDGFARSLKSTGSQYLTYVHGHTDREVARNFLCGGRSNHA